MKAILVDDEEMSRNVLRELLETYCPDVRIAGEASDYLLKPVSIEELKAAVQKMKEKQSGQSRSRQFEILLSNLQDNKGTNNQIALPTLEGLEFVNLKKGI